MDQQRLYSLEFLWQREEDKSLTETVWGTLAISAAVTHRLTHTCTMSLLLCSVQDTGKKQRQSFLNDIVTIKHVMKSDTLKRRACLVAWPACFCLLMTRRLLQTRPFMSEYVPIYECMLSTFLNSRISLRRISGPTNGAIGWERSWKT